ncbi:type II 3-dehydroquinate dehydratase [Nakamurella endophytica]|uniref:3-dehydroquinate dehydratase n=1 Tax=Nakamurella endophytica TaxID=1748367 RepID=A0A917T8A5_9ACTN|nr:type II 3-dehydroquinate dehydratase [Nakamurella endophytica]GGM13485.1 3-dehydroquinate dehydratase 2 [Nakamurella endophytica]
MTQSSAIVVLNGPNLNLLGSREPGTYGNATLADAELSCRDVAERFGRTVEFFQSNHEGALIDRIHRARGDAAGLVLNAGGLSHTSISLRDAVLAVELPMVEVHLSNVHRREAFRHHSYLSSAATGVIVGLGIFGYRVAVEFLCRTLPPVAGADAPGSH